MQKKEYNVYSYTNKILLTYYYMKNINKVKKWIDKLQEIDLVQWKIWLINLETGEILETKIKTSKYKLKLSNNKHFMKKHIDRKINLEITRSLRDIDLWFLYKVINYIDEENVIDFKRLKIDFNYNDSKLSKAKKPLFDNLIIKQDKNNLIYLNPLVWIKEKEISQELLVLFKDSFEKYWVELTI